MRHEVFEKATATASGHVPTAREIKQVVELQERNDEMKLFENTTQLTSSHSSPWG